jgi:membrane fusion protein (multidrug efflux system)
MDAPPSQVGPAPVKSRWRRAVWTGEDSEMDRHMRWWPTALTMLLAMSSGCGETKAEPGPAAGGPPAPAPPALVEVVAAESGALRGEASWLGRVEAAARATIAPGVAGTIVSLPPREGDAVEAGETLLTLDTAIIEPRVAAAKAEMRRVTAELRLARAELARARTLKAPVVTAAEKERFESRVAMLEAQLRLASAQADALAAEAARHTLVAPWPGVVARRLADPGAWVNPGTPVLELLGREAPEVFVEVPADVAAGLSPGDTLSVRSDPPTPAVIAGIVPAVDTTTRTMTLRLVPNEARPWLIPGRTVDVVVPSVQRAEGAVIVPRDALRRGPVSTRVLVITEGSESSAAPGLAVDTLTVEVLGTAGDKALIRHETLAAGARVVVRGNERLRPGQRVSIAPAPKADAPPPQGAP